TLSEATLSSAPAVNQLARACALALSIALSVMVLILIAASAGFHLHHTVTPFLHPRDQATLPLLAHSLQSQFPVVVVWLAILALATAWYVWGLRREQWMHVFAALTVCTSSSLYFTNALFHPLLAWERTYKPFMRGVRSTVKNAPLYFYKDASDYGAIFYADRHIPSYTGNLPSLPVDGNASTPLYLLMWEEDWQ